MPKESIEWIFTKKIKIQIVTNWCLMLKEREHKKTVPHYMEGWINGFRFKTMIDMGSPVPIFAVDETKKIFRRKDVQGRQMVEGVKFVDFNGKP